MAIRAAVAKLSPLSLRRLREGLFKLQLQLIEDMITTSIDVPKVTAITHVCRTIDAVDMLSSDLRARP
jgi:hypothetical protein